MAATMGGVVRRWTVDTDCGTVNVDGVAVVELAGWVRVLSGRLEGDEPEAVAVFRSSTVRGWRMTS